MECFDLFAGRGAVGNAFRLDLINVYSNKTMKYFLFGLDMIDLGANDLTTLDS